MSALRLGYVATGYPFPSHTFIQNEVRALRRLGAEVRTFTPQRAAPEHVLSEADREAYATTYAIRPFDAGRFLRAHLAALASGGWLRGLRAAWAARGPAWESPVWQLMYFGQAVVLWHAARRAGVAHLHSHFANVGGDVAQIAAAVGGEGWSWSFTMHGPTEFYDLRFFRLGAKVRSAAFVACISDFARSQLMAVSRPEDWPKLRVVHCGIDRGSLPPRAERQGDGPLRVVCVGRLVPEKGQIVLVEAIAELRRRGVDAQLVLIGDGPARATIEQAVAAHGLTGAVQLTGAQGHPEVLRLVAGGDVFCLASFAEGVPVSLMEAMALGLPVVSTRIMGIPELVADGETGVLVAPGNSDELVAALERLAVDAALRERLGRAGQARVTADYDLARESERLHGIFTEVVG